MEAHQLLKAGKLKKAIASLEADLAAHPGDSQGQTFLFELICFTGNFSRAEQQLQRLIKSDHPHSEAEIARYQNVIRAERERQAVFGEHRYPKQLVDGGLRGFRGTLNGKEFLTFSDADGRIRDKLEVFVAGEYFWIGFSDIRRLTVPQPKRLRDLLWLPAELSVVPSLKVADLHDVWLPMLTPLTWQHPDEEVQLGQVSDWRENQFGDVAPYGIKSYLADGVDVPLAEIRELVIEPFGPVH